MSMLPEQIELISVLNAHSVEYLVVGGHAVMEYSEPRATKDLDIFIRNDVENAVRLFRALAEFGAPLAGFSPADFQDGTVFHFASPPHRVDILQTIDGVDFGTAWERRVHTTVGDAAVPATFIALPDLIANKMAAGRLRDLADVEALRDAEKARQKS
jgi:hypothetical protein